MDQKNVFHGCFNKNRGGTNRLIAPGQKCITSTSKPFWKFPQDITSGVRACSQEQKQKKVTRTQFKKYFQEKDIEKRLNFSENFGINFKQLMNIFIFVRLVGFLIFNIVNNGNILTDGRRYRRPRIEMLKCFTFY